MSIHAPCRPRSFVDDFDDRTEAEKLAEQHWVDAMAALGAEQDAALSAFLRFGVDTYDVRNSSLFEAAEVAERRWSEAVARGQEVRRRRRKDWDQWAAVPPRLRGITPPAPPYHGPRRGGIADRASRAHGGIGLGGLRQRAIDWASEDQPEGLLGRCEADLARAGRKLLDAEDDGDLLEIDRWTAVIASFWQKHAGLVLRVEA